MAESYEISFLLFNNPIPPPRDGLIVDIEGKEEKQSIRVF